MSEVVTLECRGRYTMWHHLPSPEFDFGFFFFSSQKGLISAVCVILIFLDLRRGDDQAIGHSVNKSQVALNLGGISDHLTCVIAIIKAHNKLAHLSKKGFIRGQNQNPMAFSIRLPDS